MPVRDPSSTIPHIPTDGETTYSDTSAFPNISTDVPTTNESGTNYIMVPQTPETSVGSSAELEASMTMMGITPHDATFISAEYMSTTLKTTRENSSSAINTVNLMFSTIALFSEDSTTSSSSVTVALQSTSSSSFDTIKDTTRSFHGTSSDGIPDGQTSRESTLLTSLTTEMTETFGADTIGIISTDESDTTTTTKTTMRTSPKPSTYTLNTALTTIYETTAWISGSKIFFPQRTCFFNFRLNSSTMCENI